MILFVISEALQGLRRNSVIFISLVLVTFISLTFIGASGMLQMQIHNLREYWNSKAQISIDFCSPLSEAPKCGDGGDECRAGCGFCCFIGPNTQTIC